MLNQRLTEKQRHSDAAMSSFSSFPALAIKQFLNVFFPKPPEDDGDLTYLSEWEREKVINFGLTVDNSSQNHHKNPDIHFSRWDVEKAKYFDLVKSSHQKNTYRHQETIEQQFSVESFPQTPDLNIVSQPPKQEAQPVVRKPVINKPVAPKKAEREIDDFFKILGYE